MIAIPGKLRLGRYYQKVSPQKEPRQPSNGLDLGRGLTFRRAPALNACLALRSRLKKHFTRL